MMKECTGGHFIICFVEKDVEAMVLSTGPKCFFYDASCYNPYETL